MSKLPKKAVETRRKIRSTTTRAIKKAGIEIPPGTELVKPTLRTVTPAMEAARKKNISGHQFIRGIKFDFILPKNVSVNEEAKVAGPKRIAPDRIGHQQLTPEAGMEGIIKAAKDKAQYNADSWLNAATKVDVIIKKYGDMLPVRSDANTTKYPDLFKDRALIMDYRNAVKYLKSPSLKALKDELNKIGEMRKWNTDKEEKARRGLREEYIKLIKDDISKGYRYPEAVLNFDKSFKTAVDSRERYEKGLRTSFSSDDSRIVFDDAKTIGAGMKRQDGKPITPAQIEEIKQGVYDTMAALKLDIGKLAQHDRWVYVHLNGKNPFLMSNVAGLYRRDPKNDSVSISVGGAERYKKIKDGKEVTEVVHTTMAHELGHALDAKTGWKLFDFSLLFSLARTFNKVEFSSKGGSYWRSDREVTARMIEEYVAVHKGFTDVFERQGYWTKDIFYSKIKPAVEEAINKHFSVYKK